MTDFRVWHPSRDPYHCIFRMVRILLAKSEAIQVEKLRILDMFLLYPSLMHRLSLPSETKKKFRSLKIPTPSKEFVRLPGTASVWQELQIYQSTALKQLAGRGLLRRDSLRDHYAQLILDQLPAQILKRAKEDNQSDTKLVSFLVNDLADLPVSGPSGLVKRAGIPARGPIQ
ncbi:ABC-three component system middle component 5 [Ruegeria sp. R8_2]